MKRKNEVWNQMRLTTLGLMLLAIPALAETPQSEPTAKRQVRYSKMYETRANARVKKGDYAHALEDYGAAVKLNPDEPRFYFERGVVYERLKDFDRAILDYGETLRRNPNDPEARKALARAQGLKFDAHFEFVYVAPGTFLMGSAASENGRFPDEAQHQVTITKGFEMQTTLVTQSLWEKVMGANPSFFKGANLPVQQISWNDVHAFIEKLNELRKEEGFKYRLPTEAEWEFAARGGTQTAYSFGDDPSQLWEFGWFFENSGSRTHPVATLKPNPLGLLDMQGNVWQWVEDAYQENLGTAPVIDPKVETGSYPVVRGGGWSNTAQDLRSASRGPGARDGGIGFRLVRTPE